MEEKQQQQEEEETTSSAQVTHTLSHNFLQRPPGGLFKKRLEENIEHLKTVLKEGQTVWTYWNESQIDDGTIFPAGWYRGTILRWGENTVVIDWGKYGGVKWSNITECCFVVGRKPPDIGQPICVWWDGKSHWPEGWYTGKVLFYWSKDGESMISVDYGMEWEPYNHSMFNLNFATFEESDEELKEGNRKRGNKSAEDGTLKGKWNFSKSLDAIVEGRDMQDQLELLNGMMDQLELKGMGTKPFLERGDEELDKKRSRKMDVE